MGGGTPRNLCHTELCNRPPQRGASKFLTKLLKLTANLPPITRRIRISFDYLLGDWMVKA